MVNTSPFSKFGLTQAQIAAILGISQPAVHRKVHGFKEWNRREINALLAHIRADFPTTTYDEIFGEEALSN